MNHLKTILLIACLSLFLIPAGIQAQERILSFDSRIDILAEGDVVVTETIRVVAAGKKIRRGIYRDFPTRYRNNRGSQVIVRFEVLEVLRDNRPEAYHTEQQSNGIRVYMGKKGVFLQPGEYTYTLVYRTDRQIGFFSDYDELYWNATGNGWDFVIEKARAVIQLPPGAEVIQYAAYTGPVGADGQDYTIDETEDDFGFSTTRALKPREGLTIAVAWPKGYVTEPDTAEKIGYLLGDNRGLMVALCGLFVLLVYYAVAWWKVGRDPAEGAVIPRYTPPNGISPAAMRFVLQMGFDKKALAVAVVSMAIKGFLTITEDSDEIYSLEIAGSESSSLSPGEAKVARNLFPLGSRSITLKNTSHKKVGAAVKALRTGLSSEYEKVYFLRNTGYFIPGIAISLLALGGIVLTASQVSVAMFMMIWLSGWSAGVYFLAAMVIAAWRSRQVAGATTITLFALPFFGGEIFGLGMLATAISLPNLILFIGIVLTNIVFYHLLKAPTLAGRRLMDEIEGLKLYMSVAEKDRLNLLNPPDRTPAHFEALLPHAMALDVENDWNDQFADVLAKAAVDPTSGSHHTPSWYSGRTPFNGLASSLGGSFAGAISASSSAPGSSSGSGGGGSSGGGGGGGGGGGW
ncbi:MAG: DUF2207 domain-containing protein [Desulfosarcina sp.]|nr:DUF2207 domain-containing protein [Desulfosarcina sp.]MBC2742791.1 DUF2207 domain-containing protein [Desulfosarcina sp.]MBC2765701.1 DUF2207 domain-containing protein [Desulfosarcina sp.]